MAIVTGDKRIVRKLKSLPRNLSKKIVRKAARQSLKPVVTEAKNNAPVLTGVLKRGIKVRALKRSRKAIGARVVLSEKTMAGDSFYASFVEYGYTTPTGRKIEGQRFLERAFDSQARKTQERFRTLVGQLIKELT